MVQLSPVRPDHLPYPNIPLIALQGARIGALNSPTIHRQASTLFPTWMESITQVRSTATAIFVTRQARLDVVIEMKLVRMGAQPDGINLLFSLVVEPGLDHVAGEDIAAQQERVIAFERVKRLVERSGRRFHLLCFGGRGVIEIFVDRAAWIDAVVYAVEAGHQHRGEGQIGIAGGIR